MPLVHWLLGLPIVAGGTIFAVAGVATGLTTYAGVRFAVGRQAVFENSNLALHLFRVVGTLLVLLLSLTFADVRIETGAIRNSVDTEAGLLGDVLKYLDAFDTPDSDAIIILILDYIDAVVEDEWEALQHGGIDTGVLELFREIEIAILNLEPTTPLQFELLPQMLDDMDDISSSRVIRLTKASRSVPVFLYVAFLAFLPVFLVVVLIQKHLSRGLTMGAVKG